MMQSQTRQIPLLDLKAQHATLREEALSAVTRVIDAQAFILGKEVQQLEETTQAYCGARHAIGCASGSDALFLALLALDIGHGDQVLTTPYTFFATAGSIVRAGAELVFVDIEPRTFNMDMNRVESALARHRRVKAVIPVHLYGAPAEMDELMSLTAKFGVKIIEDAAQSIGAEYKGRRCGSIGDIGCFSFYPSKNLGGYGDAGMMTTNDDSLADKLRALRVHGSRRRYYHEWVGVNSRIDALQAAVLNVKFKYLDAWTAGRQRNAALYETHFREMDVAVVPPLPSASTTRHVYNQFVIRAQRRDALQEFLRGRGVGTDIYYPLSLHQQECFASLGYRKGDFPESERAAAESLALPVYPELPQEDLRYVAESIRDFYRQS